MNNKGASFVELMFVAVAIVIGTSIVAIMIIGNINQALATTSRITWDTEALLVSNRIINSEDCLAYSKQGINYYLTGSEEDRTFTGKVVLPNTIDSRKVSIERIHACTRLFTKEYAMLIGVVVYDDDGFLLGGPRTNDYAYTISPDLYLNDAISNIKRFPVKIIYPDHYSFGEVIVLISASARLFNSRVF